MKKYNFPQNSFREKFSEIYFNCLDEIKKSDEYKNNLKKINLYKNILKNNYKVPSDTIEEFIELIQEQIELEYETAIKNVTPKDIEKN